jgi:hypothetical protein
MYNSRRFQRSPFWFLQHFFGIIIFTPKYSELDFWWGRDDPFDPNETVRFRYLKLTWICSWSVFFQAFLPYGIVFWVTTGTLKGIISFPISGLALGMLGLPVVIGAPIIALCALWDMRK